MKKFLEDLRLELNKKNLKPSEIDEIIADHEEMIRTALAEGLEEKDIASRFGDPSKLADELDDSQKPESVENETEDDYRLYKSFPVKENVIICDIHMISEDMIIQTTTKEEIRVLYYSPEKRLGECKTVESHLSDYQISFQHGLLTVKAPKNVGFLFSRNRSCDITLLIEIPVKATISDFGLVTVSGDINILNLKTDAFDFSTTSGDANFKSLTAGLSKLNTVSGDIAIIGANLKSLDSNQVSGDMMLEDVHIEGRMKTHTVSGDTKATDSDCAECEMDSVSGDIQGTEFYPKTISLRSMSGDIDLTNKEPGRIKILQQRSMSGEIHIR